MRIPLKKNIFKTNNEDPIFFYYKPFIKLIYLKRLKMVIDLLQKNKYDKILEIGYGSGVFLLELFGKCKKLYGVDIHERIDYVKKMMREEKIDAELIVGDVNDLTFKDEMFDVVICMSVLEHLKDIEKPISEIYRVVKKEGMAILGIPIKNKFMHFSFKILGYDDNIIHPSSHKIIIKKIQEKFIIEKVLKFPFWTPLNFSFYLSCRAKKRK